VGVRLLVHRHGRAVAHRHGLVLRRPHEAGGKDTSSSGPSPLAVRRSALVTAVAAASPAAATVRHGRKGGREAGGSGGSQWIKNDDRGRERRKEMAGLVCVESGTVASL
jgi:hypothetical protein